MLIDPYERVAKARPDARVKELLSPLEQRIVSSP